VSNARPNLSRFKGPIGVTGGSGFIGAHVIKRLLELGHEVRALVMPNDPARALKGLNIQRIEGDILDGDALDALMHECELVVHLAAIYALWMPQPERMHDVNVGGTREVMRAARRAGVKRVVHTSSIAAIGYEAGRKAASEESIFDEYDIADTYVLSKLLSEREALRPEHAKDMDVVVVNPAFPFGAFDFMPTPTGKIILSLMREELPFIVKGGFNGVNVRDVAEGHLLAAERGRPGERYILAGHNLSYAEFCAEVSALCGKRGPHLNLPSSLLVRLGSVAEIGARLSGVPPLFTKRSMAMTAGRYLYFDTSKAERELGYKPGPLQDALIDAIGWLKSRESPHDISSLTSRLRKRLSL